MADQMILTISYALSLPHGINPPSSLAQTSEHAFTIETTSNNREYYESLRKAISAAKDRVGEELTTWRDIVGNAEIGKEKATKAARAGDELEEDEEEEEE